MIKNVFKKIKKPFKKLKLYVKYKAGWLGIPKIVAYTGYGNRSEVFIKGCVLEDKGLAKPRDKQKIWQNILATIKRFSGDEIAGVKVKASFMGITKTIETDECGYFFFHFSTKEDLGKKANNGWLNCEIELIDNIVENQPQTVVQGNIRIVTENEDRIFVSDIDDTVMVSHSTQTLKKLSLMLFKNAYARRPLNGVETLYQRLVKGKDKKSNYPFFYVSSSEWNLYDLLDDFFNHNGLPKGVFMLKKLQKNILNFRKSGLGNHRHKYEKIKTLLNFYRTQKFILIGDSGQRDPKIYRQLALEFPGRIETIYIRKVGLKKWLFDENDLIAELEKVNTHFFQVEDSEKMSGHAFRYGYIDSKVLHEPELPNMK